jgi:drug/metabolite transporter (DMT)-like permease
MLIRAFMLGLLASLFFAVTFVLNRQMDIVGGHWIWTASLRFFFMLPMLAVLMIPGKRFMRVFAEIRRKPAGWLLWSGVGFCVFYSFICMASAYGPSWLMAAAWQVTIVAGALLSPLFYVDDGSGGAKVRHVLPVKQLAVSTVILAGVIMLQVRYATIAYSRDAVLGFVLMLVAAFAYPLGNRKMMELAAGRVDTLERLFGMTLCSMPFWAILAIVGLLTGSRPTPGQYAQTFLVALFAGIVATLLFFKATEMVRSNTGQLAVVESTQAGELVFALLGGVLVYHDTAPDLAGYFGLAVVISGLFLNSIAVREKTPKTKEEKA